MESWKVVWRNAAPLISLKGLKALRTALIEDSPLLIQGATTSPPPMQCVAEWPVEASCLLSFTGWIGDELTTVAEVEEYFARLCFDIDLAVQEPAGCRHLLNWYDETPRSEMIRELLPEVEQAISVRKAMDCYSDTLERHADLSD